MAGWLFLQIWYVIGFDPSPYVAFGKPLLLLGALVQGGAPPQVISWFIIPLTIDISTISPSY